MSKYLFLLVKQIWDWVLAPPLHWALALSSEWQVELAIALFSLVFYRPLLVGFVIGRERIAEWWTERQRVQEWYAVAGMNEGNFRSFVASLRQRADKEERLAERLEYRTEGRFGGAILRSTAARRQERAESLRDEADRLDRLWQEIEKERANPSDGAATRAKVLRLMRRVGGLDERAAANALLELNRISGSFAWISLTPKAMAADQKTRVVQLLRLMSGTTSVGEARNAYDSAFRMLQENGWQRLWENA
jgi:hypothetical protein